MDKTKNRFTFKIILSYVTLGVLALVVGFFLYSEFKFLLKTNTTTTEDEKFIETGTLVKSLILSYINKKQTHFLIKLRK
jgi:phosphate/sulfate permease